MTIVSINLEKGLLETFYAKVSELPSELIPESVSDGESDKKFAISLDELSNCNESPIDVTGGYFLHAAGAKYGVSFSENGVKFFIEATFDKNAKTILNQIASMPINYAYACKFEEREHQNRITSKKSYGTEQVWVGRNYSQYLPGIYWLNLIPKALVEQLGIPEESISSLALSCDLIGDQNYLVQLYSSSDGWQERVKEIDTWRETTPGAFYKAKVQKALDDAKTFMESSDATREWS